VRVGRAPGALELQLLARAVDGGDLAERDGAAVAELAGPVAELMARVARRVRTHAGQHAVAAEHVGSGRARDAEVLAQPVRPAEQLRLGDRRRLDAGVGGVGDLARHVVRHRVGGQLVHEGVLEPQLGEVREPDARCDRRLHRKNCTPDFSYNAAP
jgi:hypothetical protein